MGKTSLDKECFKKGVDDVLTFAPIRKLFKDAARVALEKLDDIPTMHEMNMELIRKIKRLGRF